MIRNQTNFLMILMIIILTFIPISCSSDHTRLEDHGTYTLVLQENGQALGYSPDSGLKILYEDGFAFKDLNRNGRIDPYEDWRNDSDKRARNLAELLSIDEIAGLMLYSRHQAVPTDSVGYWSSTYNGTTLRLSGLKHSALSDEQKNFLMNDNLRSVLLVRAETPRIAAEWNNNLQSFTEGLKHGIPVNISSDPRHETKATAEYNAGSGGKISLWPCPLGLAATFSPELVEEFGKIASEEYRALGITTALSPQIDLATEPRWSRFYGTFGESSRLDADMARAYIDGFQTSYDDEIEDGWGYESVNAMVKHWPGGGPEEGGRDAHYSYGKYTVYPGANFEEHLFPFLEGAFKLKGKTKKAAAVMPYYTVSYGIDPTGRNVGNGFSKYLIGDLLREKYHYDGVVCTDWGITHDYHKVDQADGKCWGVEELSVPERHYEALKAGVDQFGGNNEKQPVIEAYQMWKNEFGENSAERRFRDSARRLLTNMFRTGLFDNPYVDPDEAEKVVGNPDFMTAGYEAQIRSVVMLKNSNSLLPVCHDKKVYVPDMGENKALLEIIDRTYEIVTDPEEAYFAIVFMEEPKGGCGYNHDDVTEGGNGYVPISLQYEPYHADSARRESIAGGDREESFSNRSYHGKMTSCSNPEELTRLKRTRMIMGKKPIVVVLSVTRPMVMKEVEPEADAILMTFGIQHQAAIEIVNGNHEPEGLLPMQLPIDMETVERQMEDLPRDMECYKDSDNNRYDFAYGLNWSGQIDDNRVKKYR